MKSLVLFNNKGGVGKTTLTFNIAHMMAQKGLRTVLLDYDPQCNLSALVLGEEDLFAIWEQEGKGTTVARCIDLVRRGKGDIESPQLVEAGDGLWLLPGDLLLSRFEQKLAESWGKIHASDNEEALHVSTCLERLAADAGERAQADVVLIDVGPSLGAMNRAALLSSDAVVFPLAPDLFSLQGLKNVGPALKEWRDDWDKVSERAGPGASMSGRRFEPIGYVVQQHLARVDRPVKAYAQWAAQIPGTYREHVPGKARSKRSVSLEGDENCIAMLKHFSSLVPLAQLSRKPIFELKQADGIGGGQIQLVAKAREEFGTLVDEIRRRLQESGR
jgi:cellulose biosynthesis protein BcsQ